MAALIVWFSVSFLLVVLGGLDSEIKRAGGRLASPQLAPPCGRIPRAKGGVWGGGKFAAAGDPGMPVWKVSEPYINLWLYDEPLSYSPSFGQRISFQLVYKQRETKTTSVGIFNFGEMWHSSWLNFAVDTAPGASASMMNAGGGERQYYPDGSTKELYSYSTMDRVEDNGLLTGFIVRHSDGSREEYFS
jgi:hypothetical protein